MKKLNFISLVISSVFILISCDDGSVGPVMNENPNAPTITAPQPGENYMLTDKATEDTLLTFKWTEPDYGFPAATNFIIQMGMPGQEFADPVEIGTTTKTSYSVIVGEMNNTLLAAGLPFGQSSTVEFRVVASVNDSVTSQISEPLPLTFTPYEIIITYPEIYVPGSYQAASGYTSNWSPADAPALYSTASNNKYEGYVYMADPNNQFKFTDERSWDLNWGDNGADGTLEQNGANISLTDADYYKINVDLNALTYSILKTDWGIIGSATPTGWDSDTDMNYDPATKVWTITISLTAGEIKFRANDAWDLNYGDNEGDGYLEPGGSNIPVDEAGSYSVKLDLSTAPYSYSLTKN